MNITDIKPWFDVSPFGMDSKSKEQVFTQRMSELTEYHSGRCPIYASILDAIGHNKDCGRLDQAPFLPVSIFKRLELISVPRESVLAVLTSSGTTGQLVSKIYLDEANSINQKRVLVRISSDFIGPKRLPMLVVDSPTHNLEMDTVPARRAAVLGFSTVARSITYALNSDLSLDEKTVRDFFRLHANEPCIIFGFTFMIWKYFLCPISVEGNAPQLPEAIIVHGGGWKRMVEQSVTNVEFKESARKILGIRHVHNYYGMVEQTGSLFFECDKGYLHCSVFSDVLIRRHQDFSVCEKNERGIIQLMSVLPTSYPGHNVISEDLGVLCGEDDCECGRKGKYFLVSGRISKSEVRGCSDVPRSI